MHKSKMWTVKSYIKNKETNIIVRIDRRKYKNEDVIVFKTSRCIRTVTGKIILHPDTFNYGIEAYRPNDAVSILEYIKQHGTKRKIPKNMRNSKVPLTYNAESYMRRYHYVAPNMICDDLK